ncbi:MAG: hypothetical protein HYY37_05025 [Candidatus Aenigmarchaeota archaeon]|nr:hypothetical protein [Candidatus Aenigmarchaeota archaeon]
MVFGKITGYVQFLLSPRRKIYGLRKRYDWIRERADRQHNRERRLAALKLLDQIEPTLVLLEEQQISGYERNRMIIYVKSGVEQAKELMKSGYKPPYAQPPVQPQQRRR